MDDDPWFKVLLIIAVTALFYFFWFFFFKQPEGDWECHKYDGFNCIEWENVRTGRHTLIDPN